MTQEKTKKQTKFKKNSHWNLKKYAPVILGALSSWIPVSQTKATDSKDKDWDKVANVVSQGNNDKYSKLAIVEIGSVNAYNQSISQISIDTEAENYDNPAAVATGNGYYGQHQLGISANAGYNAKKYVAFALANSSFELRQSLAKNLLIGNLETQNRLIDNFINSLDKYDETNALEKAYMPGNPAYQKLFNAIRITPTAFKKAHAGFPDEGKQIQSSFIYEIYLRLMPHSLKNIVNFNPQVSFEAIHPAVMASVIAIAIKQGNGEKFKNAIKHASFTYYQQQSQKEWENDDSSAKSKEAPLAVASRKGNLRADNIAVLGDNILRIYDEENSDLKAEDIITAPGYKISIIKNKKPLNVYSALDVKTFNAQEEKVDIASIINNREWLKKYCGSFKQVYGKASKLIDKIPTLDTYYEMGIILDNPNLYNIMEKFYKKEQPHETMAFQDGKKNYDQIQKRMTDDFEKLRKLHSSLSEVDNNHFLAQSVTEKHKEKTENTNTMEIIRKITQNKFRRG